MKAWLFDKIIQEYDFTGDYVVGTMAMSPTHWCMWGITFRRFPISDTLGKKLKQLRSVKNLWYFYIMEIEIFGENSQIAKIEN